MRGWMSRQVDGVAPDPLNLDNGVAHVAQDHESGTRKLARCRESRPMSASTPVAGESANSERDVEAAPEDRLLATCWSSAGDAASDRADLRSPLNLRERIEAASAAGFRGFGLLSADLPAAEQEYGLSGIRAMLDDNGMADLELEGIPYWWDDGPQRAESDRIRHDLLRAAEVLGARHIKVTPDGDDAPWDREHWAAKFAELATQAQNAARGWESSSSPGRTSRRCTTDCSSSRTPDTPLRVSLSTRGILSVLIPRSRSSRPFHCIASSESSSTMRTHRSSGRCSKTRFTGAGIAAKGRST